MSRYDDLVDTLAGSNQRGPAFNRFVNDLNKELEVITRDMQEEVHTCPDMLGYLKLKRAKFPALNKGKWSGWYWSVDGILKNKMFFCPFCMLKLPEN